MSYKLKLKLHIVQPLDEVCTFLRYHNIAFYLCYVIILFIIIPFIVTVVSLTDCTLNLQKVRSHVSK